MGEGERNFVCRGRIAVPGTVEGKVRVIKEPDEIVELLEGEIIVVRMTDPDSVAYIQKAKAVITDHGGILCHAAIVCREMQKPCVVGTKTATQMLSTGDTVIIDSEANIFKKED